MLRYLSVQLHLIQVNALVKNHLYKAFYIVYIAC